MQESFLKRFSRDKLNTTKVFREKLCKKPSLLSRAEVFFEKDKSRPSRVYPALTLNK